MVHLNDDKDVEHGRWMVTSSKHLWFAQQKTSVAHYKSTLVY